MARWDFADNLTLKNIFAYQVNKNSGNLTDYDGTNLVVQDLYAPKGSQFAASSQQYNEELQLNGKFLDDKLTVIILTNCQGAMPDQFVDGLAAIYSPVVLPRAERSR